MIYADRDDFNRQTYDSSAWRPKRQPRTGGGLHGYPTDARPVWRFRKWCSRENQIVSSRYYSSEMRIHGMILVQQFASCLRLFVS